MADPKRILILTNDTGFGHRSAANAIAAALQTKYCNRCVLEIVNPLDDERAPAFLREGQADYDKLVREMPDWYKLRYELGDSTLPNALVEGALTVLLYNIMKDLIERFKPDVIVSTHSMYTAPTTAVIAVNKLGVPFLVVVTDLENVQRMWFNDSADLILVPTETARDQALHMGIPAERLLVTGIPVNPQVLEESRGIDVIRQELGWRQDLKTVLVVGSKRVKGLEDVLHIFNHSALEIQMTIVAGGDDELYEWLKNTDWHGIVHLYNYVSNLPALMRASDVIVSKAGGLIVTESLALGRPLLMVDVTPGQEEGNANYVIKNGAGLLAATPVDALESLFHWIHDPALLAKYQERARDLGRPHSAFTISELALAAADREPLPSSQDSTPVLSKLLDLLTSFGIHSQDEADDHIQSI